MPPHLLLSIHREHVERIEQGEKTFEFRDYQPKRDFDKVVVYTTKPVGAITHVLDIGDIVEYPDQIPEDGVGNEAFNDGEKTQYAYEITKLEEVNNPISLETMQDEGITPPQSYRYVDEKEASRLNLPFSPRSTLDDR